MIHHADLESSPSPMERVGLPARSFTQAGVRLSERKLNVKQLVKQGEIAWGGNKKLKIYGTLTCASGKRMKKENRVFFSSEKEAIRNGYRPCGNCLSTKYQTWKDGFI
jgi:methylphosphotriester-DNA--protein-cysteine methyltransferase